MSTATGVSVERLFNTAHCNNNCQSKGEHHSHSQQYVGCELSGCATTWWSGQDCCDCWIIWITTTTKGRGQSGLIWCRGSGGLITIQWQGPLVWCWCHAGICTLCDILVGLCLGYRYSCADKNRWKDWKRWLNRHLSNWLVALWVYCCANTGDASISYFLKNTLPSAGRACYGIRLILMVGGGGAWHAQLRVTSTPQIPECVLWYAHHLPYTSRCVHTAHSTQRIFLHGTAYAVQCW